MTKVFIYWAMIFILSNTASLPPPNTMRDVCVRSDSEGEIVSQRAVSLINDVPEDVMYLLCIHRDASPASAHKTAKQRLVPDATGAVFEVLILNSVSKDPPDAATMFQVCGVAAMGLDADVYNVYLVDDVLNLDHRDNVPVTRVICRAGPPTGNMR